MMNPNEALELISRILLKCIIQFAVILLIWWGVLFWFGDLAYYAHHEFIPISREHFDAIHYAGILMTKIALGIFFLAPYIAIKLVLREQSK